MAENMEPGKFVGHVCGQNGEYNSGRAERYRQGTRPIYTHAEGACRLISRTGSNSDAVCAGPRNLRSFHYLREPVGVDVESGEDVFAPASFCNVKEERSRSIGYVGHLCIGKPQSDVVLREQYMGDLSVNMRLVLAKPN
jgi:hypothetical protein